MNHVSKRLSSHVLVLAAAIGMLFAFAFATDSSAARKAKPRKPVAVYPAPGTPVASDETTISFRGLNPKKLGKVKVFGGKSGRHGGKRLIHSDHRGVSFVPKRSFRRGERVYVKTNLRIYNARKGDFKFRIGRFYGSDDPKPGPGTPPTLDGLHSRPDLKPQEMKVEMSTGEAGPGKFFLAPKESGLQIVDNFGRTSWFRPAGFGGNGQTVLNFQTQTLNNRPVLTFWKGASGARGFSQVGAYEILNRKYNSIATVTPGNGYRPDIHEFEITPRDTALTISYRGVRKDLSKFGIPSGGKVMDNIIQEVDIKTGAVMFEWHSIGNVALGTAANEPPDDGSAWDFFHANSVKFDGNSYLISGRRASSLFRVDRAKAKIRWVIRGDGGRSDFKMGEGTSFAYQHDFRRLPGGKISLFDNGSGRGVPTVNEESSGLILKLGGKGKHRTVSLVKRLRGVNPVVSASQGNNDVQPNGHAVVGWGSISRTTEYNEAGEPVLDISFLDAPNSSYRAFKDPWHGVPKGRPAIASENTGDGTTVWASWNGSQAVREWKVLSGPDPDSLSVIAESNWRDLETEIKAPVADAVIAVQAFNGKGEEIGQSAIVPVGTQSR